MTAEIECPACRGHGYVTTSSRSPAGYRRDHERECLRCDGDGIVEDRPPAPPSGLYAPLLPAEGRRAIQERKALYAPQRGD